MTDGIFNAIPTVVGGGLALKFIDVAYPEGQKKRKKKIPKKSKRKSLSVLEKAGI
jgi:hypothetical protein